VALTIRALLTALLTASNCRPSNTRQLSLRAMVTASSCPCAVVVRAVVGRAEVTEPYHQHFNQVIITLSLRTWMGDHL